MRNEIQAYVLIDAIRNVEHVVRLLKIDGKEDSYECTVLRQVSSSLTNALGNITVQVEDAA